MRFMFSVMMRSIVLVVMMFATPLFAYAAVTVNIQNMPNYLVEADDATGELFPSADGYCANLGYAFASQSNSQILDVSPLVVLNFQGSVQATYPDNKNRRFWVITSVTCENY